MQPTQLMMQSAQLDPRECVRCGIDPGTSVAVHLLALTRSQQFEVPEGTGDVPLAEAGLPASDVVDEARIGQVRRLALASSAFFHGFEEVDGPALEALEKVLAAKLDRMCAQLQLLARRKRRGASTAFENPVHQVLNQHCLAVKDLLEFYQSRVIGPCRDIAEKFIAESRKGGTK